jgi:hypothetical protein
VFNSKEFSSKQAGTKYQLKGTYNCNTTGVYLLSCLKFNKQYVGQTGRKFGDRLKEHLYYVPK